MSTTKLDRNLWEIALPSDRVPIKRTLMYRETYSDSKELLRPELKVVVVDLAKFIRLWELDKTYVVPRAQEWDAKELETRTKFMEPHPPNDPRGTGAIWMPRAGHHYFLEPVPRPWWKLLEPVRQRKVFHVSIGNGRHRTRFVEHAGATTMPVEVDPASVDFYMNTCGLRVEP